MCGCAGLDPGKAWNQTGRRVKGPRPLSGKGLKALCWFPHRCRTSDNMNFTRWGKGQAASFGQPRRITSIQQKGSACGAPFLTLPGNLLCPVSGVVHTQFEHRNHKRVTPISTVCQFFHPLSLLSARLSWITAAEGTTPRRQAAPLCPALRPTSTRWLLRGYAPSGRYCS